MAKDNNFKIWKGILLLALFIYFGLFYAQKIYFVNADLGRHIKNGEVFIKQHFPISTNYYSYTQPDSPTINHHWGVGVIFYFIWKYFGFAGVSILNLFIYLLAFYLFFKASVKASNFNYAFFFAVLSIPLITTRIEIRPEGFSFLFLGVYYYLLHLFREGKVSFKKLIIIAFLFQVAWVNLHIFFILGPALAGAYWLSSLIITKDNRLTRSFGALLAAMVLACLINPLGIKGFIEPFRILREYGYMIAENQSIIFMQKRFPTRIVYYHFEVLFLIAVTSFILLGRRIKQFAPQLIIMLFLSVLSWRAIRGISVFGLFFIPIISGNIFQAARNYSNKTKRFLQSTFMIFSVAVILIGFSSQNHYYTPLGRFTGLGLFPKVNAAANFFKFNGIQGPIFNNYDIGGYLIFHLFPQHKVFVDNRPEAYSVSFFKEIYEPMQANEEKWFQIDKEYGFNCIFFYRHDMTPHAQPFLIKRIKDPRWVPVFVDNYNIILLKRNKANQELIRRYELPKSTFIMP